MSNYRLRRFLFRGGPMLAVALIMLPYAAAEDAAQKLTLDVKLPPALEKPNPANIEDLRAIEAHVKVVVAKVMPAVLNVKGKAQGSGVVISEDGYVLTAGHVSGAPGTQFTLTFPDGKQVKGKALGANNGTDSGIIKITDEGKYPYCEMGNSEELKKEQWCIAIGHPGGLKQGRSPPVRLGRINGVPGKAEPDKVAWVTTEATLVGGDSGGPLFDMRGKVIGIHSRIGQSLTQNMHVPSDTFRLEWARLVKGEQWGKAAGGKGKGKAQPGIFGGVEFAAGAKELKVARVTPSSVADKAGLWVDDVITAVNGKAVTTPEEFRAEANKGIVGTWVTLDVRRGTQTIQMRAMLEKDGN